MPTLLHISDLHRTSEPHLGNDELFSALVSDAVRWDLEGIPTPDLIVVSGDLIQGAASDAPDPDTDMAAQYCEAGDFLSRLAERFFGSDRSRIVIVPGNHDVDWCRSRGAMTPIAKCPDGIATKMLQPTSGLRWDWKELQAYAVSDQRLYASRFEHFYRFRERFYEGIEPNPLAWGDEDLFFAEYPDLDLFVAGFSSWHGNDCFCHVGAITPESLALSQDLAADSSQGLGVAVWHHSISGGPRAQDYMDAGVVHRLIDFGFTVGIHGHQHYPDAAPFVLRLPNLTSMAVVGAGSLAAGDNELPMGERRQFNVIVIDRPNESITVHVRGMSGAGVFTGAHRDDFGGKTFVELSLPTPRTNQKPSSVSLRLDEAGTAIAEQRYEKALALVADMPSPRADAKRRIEIEAARGLRRKGDLIELLDPPQNMDEAVELIALFLEASRFEDAKNRLAASQPLLTSSLYSDLKATIAASEMSE